MGLDKFSEQFSQYSVYVHDDDEYERNEAMRTSEQQCITSINNTDLGGVYFFSINDRRSSYE